MTDSEPGILVLCTGNSCRSQMAEAFLRRELGDRFPVYSAGTEPATEVHPTTREVMAEIGIDLSDQEPTPMNDILGVVPLRTVIIVCDGADRTCPTVGPGGWERLFWPFEDPAAFEGSDEERRKKFREIRDAIRERVLAWIGSESNRS